MLNIEEIKTFVEEDKKSDLKRQAKKGQDYYDGNHDILHYRMYYYDANGTLVEDTTRSNVKIPHQFLTELVDQSVQHILSGSESIFTSKDPALQKKLDEYFNKNETFVAELSETITGQATKGFDYMYAYKGADDKLIFQNADSLSVIEVDGRFTADGRDQVIYRYLDRVSIDEKELWKIRVIDNKNTYYYTEDDTGKITVDEHQVLNPRPHQGVYISDNDSNLYVKEGEFDFLPFFRLDNNKKRVGLLNAVKSLIDDYDIMASSLTNNLIDFDTPLYIVRGYQGDDLNEVFTNVKTKKMVGVEGEGGIDVKTVDIPYEARVSKLELDEKNIYRFGMGLNTQGLKDTSATTNIAIKAAYSLLELRCGKMLIQIKQFLRKILTVAIAEINEQNNTNYTLLQVDLNFRPEIMSNASENADIALKAAQEQQARITSLLDVATLLDNETLMQAVCEVLDIDYEMAKNKLPNPDEANKDLTDAQKALIEGNVVIEQ